MSDLAGGHADRSASARLFPIADRSLRSVNLVLGSTGSVAAVKIPQLCDALLAREEIDFRIILLATEDAMRFIRPADADAMSGSVPGSTTAAAAVADGAVSRHEVNRFGRQRELEEVIAHHRTPSGGARLVRIDGQDEWGIWASSNATEVLHIELRRWADLCVVAPLSAHSLAKLAAGLCDTVLLELLRAWEYAPLPDAIAHTAGTPTLLPPTPQPVRGTMRAVPTRPVAVCPAMNTSMWTHPLTARHVATVRDDLGYAVWGPVAKRLACGDVGLGGMVEVPDLVDNIVALARESRRSAD